MSWGWPAVGLARLSVLAGQAMNYHHLPVAPRASLPAFIDPARGLDTPIPRRSRPDLGG